MLIVHELHAGYGATPILFGVSLEVRAGEAVALLGRNGMGKTTFMKTAMGFLRPWRGRLEFEGHDLTRLRPHAIARLGIGFVPENRRIFPGLTVRENLDLGLSAVRGRRFVALQDVARVREEWPPIGVDHPAGVVVVEVAQHHVVDRRRILPHRPQRLGRIAALDPLDVALLVAQADTGPGLEQEARDYVKDPALFVFGREHRSRWGSRNGA